MRINDASAEFGAYLRQLRLRNRMSQGDVADHAAGLSQSDLPFVDEEDFAKALSEITGAFSQSTLARLEGGKIMQPKASTLMALSSIYKEPYENIISAYVAASFYRTSAHPNQKEHFAGVELSGGKPAFQPFFISNVAHVFSLREIAKWEQNLYKRSAADHEITLWIVSPVFIDHESQEFLEIVVDFLLAKGARLTYFVDQRDIGPGEKFDLFIEKATQRIRTQINSGRLKPEEVGAVSCYGLTSDELAWLTASFVVANPESLFIGYDGLDGFMIVPLDGEPAFGLALPDWEIKALVRRIHARLKSRREAAAKDQNAGIWIENALESNVIWGRTHAKI